MIKHDHFLWEEAYRPTKLSDVIIPDALKTQFSEFVAKGQIPNMTLFSSGPGTGKTTTAKALCEELGIKPLFINASVNNSIDDIRMMVIQYSTTVSLFGDKTKIVILDEADRLSANAQDALKGVIEQSSANCRFILTSNSTARLIEHLLSRCQPIEFAFSKEDQTKVSALMFKRCRDILTNEGIAFVPAVLAKIVAKYVPDNRALLSRLQRYSTTYGRIDEGILSVIKSAEIEALVSALKEKNFQNVKQWCFVNQDVLNEDFYQNIFKTLESQMEEQEVPELILILDEWQTKHKDVPDKFIHFAAMMTNIMMRLKFKA